MELQDALKIERYKFVTDRLKYFTDLARDAFASYVRFLTALVVGGIALMSGRTKLELAPDLVLYLMHGIAYLITFLGLVAIGQILFCLRKWSGFRRAEHAINPDSPKPSRWSWLYEFGFVLAIVVTVWATWHVYGELPRFLSTP